MATEPNVSRPTGTGPAGGGSGATSTTDAPDETREHPVVTAPDDERPAAPSPAKPAAAKPAGPKPAQAKPAKPGATPTTDGASAPARPAAPPEPAAGRPPAARTVDPVSVPPAARPAAVADARSGSGATAATVAAPAARPSGPRRARLLVTRLDPWSVMKTAFMLSVSIGIVLLVATALLWWTLDVTQVFSTIGRTVNDIAGSGTTSFDFLALVGFSRVMGVALVLTAIEIVLWSALATLFAFLYNLSVGLTGGVEVTLSEDA